MTESLSLLNALRHLGARAFGLVLVIAACAKLVSPWAAAFELSRLGLSFRQGQFVEIGVIPIEFTLGIYLLAVPSFAALGGAALGVMLTLFGITHLMIGAHGSCGCLGDIQIPQAWMTATAAAGTTLCSWEWRARARVLAGTSVSRRFLMTGVILLGTMAVAASFRICGSARPDDFLRASLSSNGAKTVIAVLVDSTCRSCNELVVAHDEDDNRYFYFFRESDAVPADPSWDRRRTAKLPDEIWWSLIDGSPPAEFTVTSDGITRIQKGTPICVGGHDFELHK
jgi:hypothetical protein